MTKSVDHRSPAVEAMALEWPMLEALMGGTRVMRAMGTRFLPKFPGEDDAAYRDRLSTATLFPAFRRTVGVMAGKPFSRQLVLDGASGQIEQWAEDIDRQGVNLHAFASEMMVETLAYGLCGILVEAPRPVVMGRPATRAEELAAGVRPYFVRIHHNQIIGFRVGTVNGSPGLTQLRLAETRVEPDGPWGERLVELVRVLEPGSWQLWRKVEARQGESEWVLDDEGVTSLNIIPFVPLYGRRLGMMNGASPLVDLAYLNVKHWQSQSDQDNITHVARVPILTAIGGGDDLALSVGASTLVSLPQGADMKFVEHSGAAIGAGAQSLKDLEDQMIQAGAELLVKASGDRSATEAANDAEANKSELQRIVETFEDALDQALAIMAQYAGEQPGASVSLFKDFGAKSLSEASGQLVVSLYKEGLIRHETAIAELKRRGELAAEVDAEEEELGVGMERQGIEPEEPIDPITGQPLARDPVA